MKSFRITATLILFALFINGFAQNNSIEQPYIEVEGTAIQYVLPDEIYIAITIKERLEGKEKVTIEQQEQMLKTKLTAAGISSENLFFSDANASYIKVRLTKKDVIASADYTLKVNSAEQVKTAFETLEDLKIVGARISKVSHSDIINLRTAVKADAIKAAKSKATMLLSAIDEELGKPLVVYEQKPQQDNFANYNSGKVYSLFDEEVKDEFRKRANEIQFKKIKLKAKVYVKFEIKQG